MKKGEIYEGRVQEVLFPDKAIVVTDEGETAQVKYGIPGQKIRFRVKKREATLFFLYKKVLKNNKLQKQ